MEKLQLKELVDIYLGVTHTPKYVYAGVPFLSVKDISGGQINFDNCKYISEEEYNSLSQGAKPQVGDMLFCRVGTIGKPIIIPKGTPRFGSFVSLGYLRNKDNSRCRMDYLKHWMNSKSFYDQVQSNVKGASQVNLNTGWLSKFEVRLPDYREQSDIVATLDLCERIINNRNLELQKLDNLIKARFVEMFGDPMVNNKGFELKTYGDLFELNAGGTPSKTKSEYWDGGTISWIGSNMCQDTYIYENDGNCITEEGLAHSSARIFPIDTVLVALVGATIGKTALLKFETATNQNVLGIRKIRENGYLPEFVFYYTQGLYKRFLNIGDGGFAMASKGFISKLPIPVVSISSQEEFSSFAKQIDKSKVAVQKALDEAQLLFDSLMQEYFG